MTKILDCTTRDGGHTVNWNFDREFVFELINKLNISGTSFYEIGYRNHFDNEGKGQFYNCGPEFLKQFYKVKGNLILGVMTDTKRYCVLDFPGQKEDFIDFVRIACHPDKISKTLGIAKDLHDKGYMVFVQLMDISNVDEAGYETLSQWKHKQILESLYFADSYGILVPKDIEKYYKKLKTLGYDKLSFHGHNKMKKALANSLKAIELGAYTTDVTQNGIGRCGGNLDAKEINRIIHPST